jgi:hypothetical protein
LLEEIQSRFDTYLATHYHPVQHGSLAGGTPASRWTAKKTRSITDTELAAALTIRSRRRVSKDCVLSIDGRAFEVRQGFLAGRVVEVQSCLVDGLTPSVRVEHDGASYALRPLDVRQNAKTRRPARSKAPAQKIPFDPFKPSKSK